MKIIKDNNNDSTYRLPFCETAVAPFLNIIYKFEINIAFKFMLNKTVLNSKKERYDDNLRHYEKFDVGSEHSFRLTINIEYKDT